MNKREAYTRIMDVELQMMEDDVPLTERLDWVYGVLSSAMSYLTEDQLTALVEEYEE